MPIPQELEQTIKELEAEVGQLPYPFCRANCVADLRREKEPRIPQEEDELQLEAAQNWVSQLKMVLITKRCDPELYGKMLRFD